MKFYSIFQIKRVMDLFLGVAMLVIAAPLMIAIAISIVLTSRGPFVYKQKRNGAFRPEKDEQSVFILYKFRTMVADAEKRTGVVLSRKNDPRTTSIGRILRKTRLDELPQLVNVVRGDMSIVGPRPERPELMQLLSLSIPFFEERLRNIKPGITGLAQVNLTYNGQPEKNSPLKALESSLAGEVEAGGLGEDDTDGMRFKFLYDMAYGAALERFSSFLKTDLSIMLKTPVVMFVKMTGR